MLLMRQLQQAQRPWHAHRFTADHCVIKLKRFAFSVEKTLRLGGHGCSLAPVICDQRAITAIVEKHECATADAGRLWLDQIEHHLRRDRGIDGAATLLEHLVARIDCQWIRCSHHVVLAGDGFFGCPAGGKLWRLGLRPRQRGREQQPEQAQPSINFHDRLPVAHLF